MYKGMQSFISFLLSPIIFCKTSACKIYSSVTLNNIETGIFYKIMIKIDEQHYNLITINFSTKILIYIIDDYENTIYQVVDMQEMPLGNFLEILSNNDNIEFLKNEFDKLTNYLRDVSKKYSGDHNISDRFNLYFKDLLK